MRTGGNVQHKITINICQEHARLVPNGKTFSTTCAPCTQWSSLSLCVLKMIFARVYHLAASAQQISCNQSRNSVDEIYHLPFLVRSRSRVTYRLLAKCSTKKIVAENEICAPFFEVSIFRAYTMTFKRCDYISVVNHALALQLHSAKRHNLNE